MILPQLDSESLLGCLCEDFCLAVLAELELLFNLKYFDLVCCLWVFFFSTCCLNRTYFLVQLQLWNQTKSGTGTYTLFFFAQASLRTQRNWAMAKNTCISWLWPPTTVERIVPLRTCWSRSVSSPPANQAGKVSKLSSTHCSLPTVQLSLVRCVFVEQKQSTDAESWQATVIKKIIWLF